MIGLNPDYLPKSFSTLWNLLTTFPWLKIRYQCKFCLSKQELLSVCIQESILKFAQITFFDPNFSLILFFGHLIVTTLHRLKKTKKNVDQTRSHIDTIWICLRKRSKLFILPHSTYCISSQIMIWSLLLFWVLTNR